MFAKIIVDISHEKVDRPFCYIVPPQFQALIKPGMRVQIPFGRGNTLRTGYVIELTKEADFPESRLKEIQDLLPGDKDAESKMIALAAWMKEHYGSTMIQALKTVLPQRTPVKQKEKKQIRLLLPEDEARKQLAFYEKKNQKARARLLLELIKEEVLPGPLVTGKLHITGPTLKAMEEAGVISVTSIPYYRNPIKQGSEKESRLSLSQGQQHIVNRVLDDISKDIHKTYLLHGVTGSGKTEVYLDIIEGIVRDGKQAIVLIPEIALTYQTVLRFYKRFKDRVSVMNSTLSPGEKYDQCERAKRGEIDVIIGPRSALFTPFPNVGIIVIDEEHENSYKSETMPRYHARETACELARLHGASVLLGSATPSLEAYAKAKTGEYELFTLKERLTGGCLPEVYVEDLRKELKEGNRSIFSRNLKDKLEERLQKKEQIMLFLNRRGYAGFISCRACGMVMKCPHCDVSLSEHRGRYENSLVCHYCGYETAMPGECPECGSKYILGFKAGTQQVEEQLLKMYPQARVLRMDADTTRTKDSYEKILSAFAAKEADILVGTQMIVKGHDFPAVTLVGILAADMSLSAADYRAAERTFQLLTQAAGRAGRGSLPGEVVIQTYQPEHYSIQYAKNQDYEGFFEEEILYRELSAYPPMSHLLSVQTFDEKKEDALEAATEAAELGKRLSQYEMLSGTQVIGPAPALVGKINDVYRYGVYMKNKDYEKLIIIKNQIEKMRQSKIRAKATMQFDFDPVSAY